MLVKPHAIVAKALSDHFAIGAFNASNLEFCQAIIWAAHAQQSPVIVATSESAIKYAGVKMMARMVEILAAETNAPIILHLDHGKSLETVKTCIDAGYTSVMIDASVLPLDENITVTRSVVEYAHDRGVWVEAELGAILGKEGVVGLSGAKTPEVMFTKPTDAEHFIEATGVDALAVSVGTIHGAFTGQEYIRFELLKEIEQAIPHFPLVLHGASGIADEHVKQSVTMNVTKVNVDTEIRIAFEQAVTAYVGQSHDDIDPRKLLASGRAAVQDVVEKKMHIFGSIHYV